MRGLVRQGKGTPVIFEAKAVAEISLAAQIVLKRLELFPAPERAVLLRAFKIIGDHLDERDVRAA